MGNITNAINIAFRDFVSDGIASSGAHEVIKSDVRDLGPVIEGAIGLAGLGSLIAVTKTTKAILDADLAHDADTVALVYADATGANNDLYVKVGASGTGSWSNTGAIAAGWYSPAVELAQAWAEGTEPGGPGTKSAYEWSIEAANAADLVNTDVAAVLASDVTFRKTLAEGIADFAVGEYFVSTDDDALTANTGLLRLYKRILASPYYEDQGDAAAPWSRVAVRAFDANGLGIVVGDTTYSPLSIGAGSLVIGGWTASLYKHRITGTATNLRAIIGGYDCEIGAALASVIVGSHHSTISTGATHGSIFGGSHNTITAGNYGTIGGGTANSLAADNSVISGGTTNSIGTGSTSSVISGGTANSVSNSVLRAAIGGGSGNQITGGNDAAIVGGVNNVISSGGKSVAGGEGNALSGAHSWAFGLSNTVTAPYAAAWGRSNTVSKDYGTARGYRAVARSTGMTAAGGYHAAVGDAQYTDIPAKAITTSNATVYLNGADGNQFVVPLPTDNVAVSVVAEIVGVEPATGDTKSITVRALLKRIGGANTTVGSTVTANYADAGAAAWTVSAINLSTNNLRIGVAGDAGKTVRWSAKITAVEVSF